MWFNKPQFFTYYDGIFFRTDPGLGQVPFTGEMFGVYLFPNSDTNANLQQEVNAWQSRGGVYFFASDLLIRVDSSTPADWDSFRMRTIDGAYLNLGGVYASYNTPMYSLSSPVFQATLKAAAMRAVDLGADGMTFDDTIGQLYEIEGDPHSSGSFDTVTMAAFQSYLQQKYSAATLLQQFGIPNIASFNYGAYINANSITETWNSQPFSGLSREFYLFKRQELLNFLLDLVISTKQYALQTYGRNFLFNCNEGDDPQGYFITEMMDLEYAELPEIRGGDHPFAAVDVKAWKGWKNSITVKPAAMDPSWSSTTPPFAGPTVNLERVLIADEAAAGAMSGATVQLNEALGDPQPVNLSVVSSYANFILSNPQLMSQTTTPASVALIESATSMLGGLFVSPAEPNPWNGPRDYFGTGRLLLDSGITYNSVFLPDTTYSQLPPLTLGTLTPYKVVIAPSAWALDENQVSVLLQYAQQGGILVIFGSFGNSEEDASAANRPQLAILPQTGAIAYGAGQIVVTQQTFGVTYENGNNVTQLQTLASFQAFLAPYIQPDVTVSGVTGIIHEPGITPFHYLDSNGHALVHLVNYDYNDATDQFYTKTNVTVKIQVGSQPVDAVILRSPDIAGVQSLRFTRSGDTISLTVPEVDSWVVLYFRHSTAAPIVVSSSPAPASGAVGGIAVSFTVQSSDPDGNPLAYIWSVNGQVVATGFYPYYTLQLPQMASGPYTVTVVVTDGSRFTQRTWAVNVAAYHTPRVLFDDSHSEEDTIDPTQASLIDPGDPSTALFGNVNQALQGRVYGIPSHHRPDYATGPGWSGCVGSRRSIAVFLHYGRAGHHQLRSGRRWSHVSGRAQPEYQHQLAPFPVGHSVRQYADRVAAAVVLPPEFQFELLCQPSSPWAESCFHHELGWQSQPVHGSRTSCSNHRRRVEEPFGSDDAAAG